MAAVEHASSHLNLLSYEPVNSIRNNNNNNIARLKPSILCVGANGYFHFVVITCCLGSMCLGLVMGYTSPAVPDMDFLNEEEASWFISTVTLAAIPGALATGALMDRFGRKLSLIVCVPTPVCVGWTLIAAASRIGRPSGKFVFLLMGRILNGFGVGAGCLAIPTYLTEISTPRLRGATAALHSLFGVVGIELAYAMGTDPDIDWAWQALISMAPVAAFAVLALAAPNSPRWLVSRGLSHEARGCLQKLRKADHNINRELREIEDACSEAMGSPTPPTPWRWTPTSYGATGVCGGGGGGAEAAAATTLDPPLVRRWARKPIAISLALMVAQQFSGVYCLVFNMESNFESVGYHDNKRAAVIVGGTQVVATLFAVLVVDNIGRRKLLMTSAAGMCLTLVLMGMCEYLSPLVDVSTLSITAVFFFFVFFCLGFGPVPNLVMAEVLPLSIRGVAAAVANAFSFGAAFVATKTFPTFKRLLHPYGAYWFYAGCTLASLLFVHLCVPETKGRSLEDIERLFLYGRDDGDDDDERRRGSVSESWSIVEEVEEEEEEEVWNEEEDERKRVEASLRSGVGE